MAVGDRCVAADHCCRVVSGGHAVDEYVVVAVAQVEGGAESAAVEEQAAAVGQIAAVATVRAPAYGGRKPHHGVGGMGERAVATAMAVFVGFVVRQGRSDHHLYLFVGKRCRHPCEP